MEPQTANHSKSPLVSILYTYINFHCYHERTERERERTNTQARHTLQESERECERKIVRERGALSSAFSHFTFSCIIIVHCLIDGDFRSPRERSAESHEPNRTDLRDRCPLGTSLPSLQSNRTGRLRLFHIHYVRSTAVDRYRKLKFVLIELEKEKKKIN